MNMTTLTSPLGYPVARFGRLTLTSGDYARVEPVDPWADADAFYLNDPKQRRDLLLHHGHDAADLVSRWRYEGERDEEEQREAYREMVHEYHNSRGVR